MIAAAKRSRDCAALGKRFCCAKRAAGRVWSRKTAYDWLYQIWLMTSGEEPRNLPCLEEYLNDPRQVPAKDLQTAVMMPLAA